MNAIEISHVTKCFRKRKVLDDVSVTVPEGVVFALLGENGAGKSTLIRGLLGYHRFDSGRVSVSGHDPAKRPLELRRAVGYVSDAPGLYEWMTVAETGWYASGFYSDGFLSRFDELVHGFEVPSDARIRDLSKGMRAKVALSLAMAFDPKIMILDEPTSGLDPLVRRSFLESMIDRAAAGQTVFLSSHQIHEVERVADWVAILHAGKLQVVSPLEDLKNNVSIISFSLRDPLLATPVVLDDLRVVYQKQQGRSVQLMVHDNCEEALAELNQDPNLFEVRCVRPNLEELYIGFTRGTVEAGASPSLPPESQSNSSLAAEQSDVA